jgi:capsid portal protein
MSVKAEHIYRRAVDDLHARFAQKSSTSQQIPKFTDSDKIIAPAHDPAIWSSLMGLSTRFRRSVQLMASNTVGMGYEVVINEKLNDSLTPDEQKKAEAKKEDLEAVLADPNSVMSSHVLFDQIQEDREATGNGWMEVLRSDQADDDGNHPITGLVYMRSANTRLTENDLIIQRKKRAKRYFVPFGSDRNVNNKTGKPLAGRTGKDSKGRDMAQFMANEVVHLRLFSPEDEYYGVPRAAAAQGAILGQYKVDVRNLDFFDYDAMPRIVIIMKGGTPEDRTALRKEVQDFVEQSRGNTESTRIMIAQVTATRQGDKPDVQLIEVGKYTQDATFMEYRNQCLEEIREAFGMGKIMYGTTDDVNRASALAVLKATVENVFHPETQYFSHVLTNTVAKDFHPSLRIRFNRASVSDLAMQLEMAATYGDVGFLTVNELRAMAEYEVVEDERADVPLVILRLDAKEIAEKEAMTKFMGELTRKAEEQIRAMKAA